MNDIELGEMHQQVTDTRQDVLDIKSDIRLIIAKIDNLDTKYYTRQEGRVVSVIFGIVLALVSFFGDLKGLFK